MYKLIVVDYKGDFYKRDNHSISNLCKFFKKYSSIYPFNYIDQPSRDYLIEYLKNIKNTPIKKYDNIILHFISHGFELGIANKIADSNNFGDLKTLITWHDLIDLFNVVSLDCSSLFINLGSVCNSNHLFNTNINRCFDVLVINGYASNIFEPMKLNKSLLINREDNYNLDKKYTLTRKE